MDIFFLLLKFIPLLIIILIKDDKIENIIFIIHYPIQIDISFRIDLILVLNGISICIING